MRLNSERGCVVDGLFHGGSTQEPVVQLSKHPDATDHLGKNTHGDCKAGLWMAKLIDELVGIPRHWKQRAQDKGGSKLNRTESPMKTVK